MSLRYYTLTLSPIWYTDLKEVLEMIRDESGEKRYRTLALQLLARMRREGIEAKHAKGEIPTFLVTESERNFLKRLADVFNVPSMSKELETGEKSYSGIQTAPKIKVPTKEEIKEAKGPAPERHHRYFAPEHTAPLNRFDSLVQDLVLRAYKRYGRTVTLDEIKSPFNEKDALKSLGRLASERRIRIYARSHPRRAEYGPYVRTEALEIGEEE